MIASVHIDNDYSPRKTFWPLIMCIYQHKFQLWSSWFNHLFCLKWIFIFIDTLFSYDEVLDMYFSNQSMFPLYDYVDGKMLGDCVHYVWSSLLWSRILYFILRVIEVCGALLLLYYPSFEVFVCVSPYTCFTIDGYF